LWVPMLLIACIALFVIGSAQAVHDEGVYQLDGNAQASDNSEQPVMPSAIDDADSICAAQILIQGTTSGNDRGQFCHKATGVTLASPTSSTRFAFVTDGSGPYAAVQGNTDDQYTGGSGDAQDLSAWAYKNAASSNDKSDIQNAFAAQYVVSSCPSDSTHAGCHVGDKVIYFGGDRTSDSGDENTAFWFLQNPAAESPNGACTAPSGCPFTTDGSAWNGIAAGTAGSNLATHKAAFPGADRCLFNPANPSHSIDFNTGGFCTETAANAAAEGDSYGDILVVSAFTGGGVQPNVTAYEWIGSEPYGTAKGADKSACGTSSCTTIKILSVSSGCNSTDSGDPACAITNQAVQSGIVGENPQPIQAPWVYSEKVGDNGQSGANTCTTVANKMCPSIFLEAGLNLSALGLQSECTSTFVMDTRSSQSVSSSLQDLTVGQVGACSSSLSTQHGDTTDVPENGGLAATAASPTSIGTGLVSSGTDTAAVQVSGASSYSGTITWFICGPFAAEPAAPKCDTTHGVPAGNASVSETDNNTHYFVSGSVNLTSKGVYCWTAHFEPASGTNSQITAKDDNGANECFTVNPVTPNLTTCSGTYTGLGTPAACVPATSVSFGSAIHDRARLSGLATEPGSGGGRTSSPSGTANPCTVAAPCFPTINANAGPYAGIITFTLKGPTAAGATGCGSTTSNSTTAGDTNPQSTPATGTGSVASTGNGTYGPVSYTPGGSNGAGVYHWQATIDNSSGSTNNNLPQSEDNANCTDTNEDVTVQQIPTSIKTRQSWYPNDTATISASSGNLGDSGTVDFFLYSGTDCTGSVLYSERVSLGTGLGTSTEVSTHNYFGSTANTPGNVTVTPFPVTTAYADAAGSTKPATAGQAYFWKVVYTLASADTGHTGRQSNCLESHHYTYTNDNSGGTVSP